MTYNATSNTTWPSGDNTTATTNSYSSPSLGTSTVSVQTTTAVTTKVTAAKPATTATVDTVSTMTTKNGQSDVFTSVRVLLGAFVLQAVWQ